MNLKYPCNLWKLLKLLLTIKNRILDENDENKLDEIKWFVCPFLVFLT